MIVIVSIVISAMIATAYVTVLICDHEVKSEWQLIKYTGSSVEPKCIYICKRCNNQREINYHYCDNCGARMKNGVSRHYYSDKINLDLD